MEVKALVNGFEVVASGIVHVVGNALTIMLDTMPVEVIFLSDLGGVRYTTEVKGASVQVSLYNFLTIGDGMISPVAVATAEGKQIYLTFWVNTVNGFQQIREFRYTILMGPLING